MELIKVQHGQIGQDEVQTVNARDLHAFLEVGKDFSTWIKDRIAAYDFVENRDFVCSPILGSERRGGHNRLDYHLTLEMAKELAMVERNERGKQARAYFIECERKMKEAASFNPATVLESPAAMRRLLLTYTEKVLTLEADKAAMQADVAALDRIANADGSLCITDAAKALQQRPKDLFNYLVRHGWIYKRAGSDHYVGYQSRVQTGDLEHKVTTVLRADGSEKVTEQVRVTPRGLTKLARLFPPAVQAA